KTSLPLFGTLGTSLVANHEDLRIVLAFEEIDHALGRRDASLPIVRSHVSQVVITLLNHGRTLQARVDDDHGDALLDRSFDRRDQRLAITRSQDDGIHPFAGKALDDLLLFVAHTFLRRAV